MSAYRLYFLDSAGHIRHALDLDCEDDAEAIGKVADHQDGRGTELWQGARLVKRFEPKR